MTRTRGKESLWFEINPRPGKSIRTNFEADAWNLEGHRDVDFERGKPSEHWLGEGWFAASMKDLEGPIEDVLRTSNLLPVFSERCKRELEAHQIHPFRTPLQKNSAARASQPTATRTNGPLGLKAPNVTAWAEGPGQPSYNQKALKERNTLAVHFSIFPTTYSTPASSTKINRITPETR